MKDRDEQVSADCGPATGVEREHLPELERLLERLEQLELEKAALKTELEAARRHEAVSVLARGIAHDMNNILGSIMGLASIMRMDSELNGQILADLESMVDACSRGRELTKNLSALAREAPPRQERLSLSELVSDIVTELRRAQSGRPLPELDLEMMTVDATIEGDRAQLRQVFVNLLLNSLDATREDGRILVTTEEVELVGRDLIGHPKLKPGRYVRCSITDNGAGMDGETLKSACKPFFSTKSEQGSGLGLAFVYGVVRNHGGRLTISSAPGDGTIVTVELAHVAGAPRTTPPPAA